MEIGPGGDVPRRAQVDRDLGQQIGGRGRSGGEEQRGDGGSDLHERCIQYPLMFERRSVFVVVPAHDEDVLDACPRSIENGGHPVRV